MERFFLNLKMERVWRQDYANHEEAMRNINDYIINFYNSQRLHSTLGYVSPNNYEANMAIKQPIETISILSVLYPRRLSTLSIDQSVELLSAKEKAFSVIGQ